MKSPVADQFRFLDARDIGFKKVKHIKIKKKRTKRIKLRPIRLLIKDADKVFSLWIRLRDNNKCVLCGTTYNVQCGHLFKRGKHALRFSHWNCHCLCSGCNFKDNFEHDHYVDWFIGKFGSPAYHRLYQESKKIHKFTREELLKVIKDYKI